MAIQISQIAVSQSFGVVIQRMNDMADAFTANVVTTGTSEGGAYTTGNAYVNGIFGSNTLYATNIAGGNISTNTILTIISNTYVNNYISVGNTNNNSAFGWVPSTQAMGSFSANINSFVQTYIRNTNTGVSSSADLAVYNDISDSSVFIDMGVVSSNWSNTQWTIGGANDGYLYTGGGNLSVGTNSTGKYINFFTGGGFAENEKMRITSTGVGIKNTNPDATFVVTGTANVSGNVRIGGVTTVANSVNVSTVDSNLIPKFNAVHNLGNSTNRWASLYVSGSTIYLGTVSLSDSGGNLKMPGGIVDGTLSVNSSITGANTIAITGNATFSNSLVVTGNSAFGNSLVATGNVTFGNTLVVTGATTLSNILDVTGAATLSNSISVTGAATLSNTISVTGAAVYSNTLNVTGATVLSNTLSVGNTSTFSNSAGFYGDVTMGRTLTVAQATTLQQTLALTGAATLSNTISIAGAATVGNTLSVTNSVAFSNSLSVTGATTFSNTVSVTGAVTLSNTLSVTNTATFSNTVGIAGAVTVNNSITANGALSVNGAVSITNSSLNITSSSAVAISVGNSTSNATVNASSITVANVFATNIAGLLTTVNQTQITANNSNYLNGNSAATVLAKSDTAYTNAAAYSDNKAAIAYSNAQSYADSKAADAYANAGTDLQAAIVTLNSTLTTSSSNATNLILGTLPSGRLTGSYTGVTAVGTLPTLSANVLTTNSITVANSITVGNNITVGGNSNVTGDLRVSGNMYITGTLAASQSAAGDIVPTANSINLGGATKRFNLYAMSGNFVEPITVSNTASFGNTMPEANGRLFGNNTMRWTISANTIDCGNATFSNVSVANVTVSTNSTLNVAVVNTMFITGVSTLIGNSVFQSNSTFNANSTFAGRVTVSNNVTVTGNTSVSGYSSVNSISYSYSTKYNVASGAIQNADTFDASVYRSAEYTVQLYDSTTTPISHQVSKLLVLHDGTTAYVTEYAQLYNNNLLGVFSADVNGGFVRLRLTPTSASVNATFTRTTLVL